MFAHRSPSPNLPPFDRLSRLAIGLKLLHLASTDTSELNGHSWQFALTLTELLATSLNHTDLRWLVARGLLSHRYEQFGKAQKGRRFKDAPSGVLAEQSCFILTEPGRLMTASWLAQHSIAMAQQAPRSNGSACPQWDPDLRVLTWHGQVVKKFQTPADCQERVLTVFQEECWPARIDDPLEVIPGVEAHERLHSVVRRLNGNQREIRIHFMRDGKGKGIRWNG